MDNYTGIITYQIRDYGRVRVKLRALLDERGITRNRLRALTGVKYDIIDRYYKAESIQMVDLDFLAKVCRVLNCGITDILEYEPPREEGI